MAQNLLIKYQGAVSVKANVPVQGSQFIAGTVLIMKTEGVYVSISGTDAFLIQKGDFSVVDTSATYTFTKDCIIAFGEFVAI